MHGEWPEVTSPRVLVATAEYLSWSGLLKLTSSRTERKTQCQAKSAQESSVSSIFSGLLARLENRIDKDRMTGESSFNVFLRHGYSEIKTQISREHDLFLCCLIEWIVIEKCDHTRGDLGLGSCTRLVCSDSSSEVRLSVSEHEAGTSQRKVKNSS